APVPLSLAAALARAVAANPALGRARTEIDVADALRRLAISAILPRLNLTGNYTRNSTEASFTAGDQQVLLLPMNDWSYRLTLSQPIYAGNRERRAYGQAKLGVTNARQGARGAEDNLLLAVAADYLAVVEGDALLDVERRNVALTADRRRQAQALFEAGETTRVDALRAEADIKAAERRVTEAQRLRDAAESRLRLDLALDSPSQAIQVAEPSQLFPPLSPAVELLAQAERQRPEVAAAETALESARLEVAKQQGAVLPILTADGEYISQRSTFPLDRYGFFALHLTVPVFQGGEVKARVAIARDRLHQADLQLEEVRRSVREEVRRTLSDLAGAEANLALAKEQLTAGEAEYEQAAELYRAQELTSLDAEAAENSLAEARRAVATGKLDRDLAELRVWAAAGLLAKTVFPEVSR
ncbi:MAG TPA: TolC family protein, partial [Thermoanaerobaculia bacterium]|nr:TolC family protein [Thermoanaerobaculia bacterium]